MEPFYYLAWFFLIIQALFSVFFLIVSALQMVRLIRTSTAEGQIVLIVITQGVQALIVLSIAFLLTWSLYTERLPPWIVMTATVLLSTADSGLRRYQHRREGLS